MAESPFDVAPTRYPFLPSLVEINEPQICSAFLAAVTDAYKGSDFDLKTVGHRLPDVEAHWLLSAEDIAAQFEGADGHQLIHEIVPLEIRYTWDYMTETEVDFAGDGEKNVLAIFGSEDLAIRRSYVIALFGSKAELDAGMAGAKSLEEITKHAAIIWRLDRPSVLEVDGAFYAVTNPQRSEEMDVREELWHLTPSGVQLACAAQLEPQLDPQSMQRHPTSNPIGSLDRTLDTIAGSESQCGGTLRFVDQTVIYADQVFRHVEARPWALRAIESYNDSAEVEAGLDRWSQRGLWNYRQLRRLRESAPAAQEFLKSYYRYGFGLSKEAAGRLANASLDALVRSHFVFPRRPQLVDTNDPSFKLRSALLAHESVQLVEGLLRGGATISNSYVESEWGASTEPTLFYALENPELVDLLLQHGADANARGNFGKTALMYAVQFNLPETVALLLKRGADVNAKTSDTPDCWSAIETTKRTALMYAAENADLAMVDLLLRRGADANALDSRGSAADGYVDRNTQLSADKGLELYRFLRHARGMQ